MKKAINNKPVEGTACELKGTADMSAALITIGVFISILLVMVLALLIITIGWDTKIFTIAGCIFLGLLLFIEGWVALFVYLVNRKAFIRIDETGISGNGKLYRKSKLNEFTYSWKEIKKIEFAHENMENQIVITTTNGETFAYSFTYRFIKHKEMVEAIRIFGKADMLDDANIKEVEESYSPRSLILHSIVIAILIILYGIYKFYLHNKLS